MPHTPGPSGARTSSLTRRRLLTAAAGATLGAIPLVGLASNCPPPKRCTSSRAWQMGFSRVPPAATLDSALQCLNLMPRRAEFVVMQEHVPWADLLAGEDPAALVERDLAPMADYIRGLGLNLVLLLELTDGSARFQEAPGLRAIGRSLTDPTVQRLYARFACATSMRIQPALFGLATETNAVRLQASPALYQSVVAAARQAAADVKAVDHARQLFISTQVEVAWGLMPGQTGGYQGIARDLADFPFTQVVGLSSYPYFPFSRPDFIPSTYYSRLLPPGSLPALVVEGGWPSAGNPGAWSTTPELQARYLIKQAALADSIKAMGVAQLLMADLDLSQWPADVAAALTAFSSLGVLDSHFKPKFAGFVWDSIFRRPLQENCA